jgi:hypothetical protein
VAESDDEENDMRHLRWAFVGSLLPCLGCGSPGSGSNPDVVISPQQLMQELISDRSGTIDRYDGKLLEISGVVEAKTTPHGLNDTLGVAFEETSAETKFDANLAYFFFEQEDSQAREEFDGLQPGQPATLVCRFSTLNRERAVFLVKACRVKS